MESTINKLPFIVDEQQLKAVVHAAVNNAVKDLVKRSKIEKPIQLKEAAAFFDMSPESLMKKAKEGEVPYYRFKGSRAPYYFYKSQIEEVLKNGKVLTKIDVFGADFYNSK